MYKMFSDVDHRSGMFFPYKIPRQMHVMNGILNDVHHLFGAGFRHNPQDAESMVRPWRIKKNMRIHRCRRRSDEAPRVVQWS